MDFAEFKRQLAKAGLTATEFSGLVKLHPKSLSNYPKQNIVPSHLAIIVTLMAELADNHIEFKGVIARLQIEPKKPRGLGKGRFGGNPQPVEDVSEG